MQSRLKTSRLGRASLVVAAVVGLATACSSAGGDTPSSGDSSPSAASSGNSLGIVEFDSTSPIDALFASKTREAMEGEGWEVFSQDPKGDLGQANAICTQYVTRKVTALVVTTYALDQMAQCMAQAKSANIPVFFLGSPLLEGMAGAVNFAVPGPLNDIFIKYLKDNQITSILTLDFTPGTPCRMRAEYRDQAIKDAGLDVKVYKHEFHIPGQVVESTNGTAAWLAANPAGAGKYAIWSCYSESTAGALAAIKQAGRTDSLPIFQWDFSQTILPDIRTGQVAATLYYSPADVAAQAKSLILEYMKTGEPKGGDPATTVITPDNVEQFLKDHPDEAQ